MLAVLTDGRRGSQNPSEDIEAPGDPNRWFSGPIVDLSADAREAAKVQFYAAVSHVLSEGELDATKVAAFSELKRRFGFEYNGMVLHEYYFGNMKKHGSGDPDKGSAFARAAGAVQRAAVAQWRVSLGARVSALRPPAGGPGDLPARPLRLRGLLVALLRLRRGLLRRPRHCTLSRGRAAGV